MSDVRFFYDCCNKKTPISKITVAGDYLYTMGDGELLDIKDPKPGMRKLFDRMQAMLKERGVGFADVAKVTALLCGHDLWNDYTQVYREYFKPPFPCRTTIPVPCDKSFIELDFVVYKKGLSELPCNSAGAARASMRKKKAKTAGGKR